MPSEVNNIDNNNIKRNFSASSILKNTKVLSYNEFKNMSNNTDSNNQSFQSTSPQLVVPKVKEYVFEKEIGKGSFAVVYRGYIKDDPTNAQYAIKAVPKTKLKNKKILENLEIEIAILKKLKHRHIVNLIDCQRNRNDFLLIMEYCSLGDLTFLIKRRNELIISHPILHKIFEKLPPPNENYNGLNIVFVLNYLQQLSSALKFLRSRNLIHRDIKPQNLLLSSPYIDYHDVESFKKLGYVGISNLPILKIADFGFARFLPNTSLAETLCGSPLYMAPEILNYQKYNAKADLWSVGTVLYEMIYGKPPFKASNHLELLKKIKKANDNIPFPTYVDVSDDMKHLINRLLTYDPVYRIDFDEFFNNNLVHKDLSIYEDNDKSDSNLESISKSCMDKNLFISEYLSNDSRNSLASEHKIENDKLQLDLDAKMDTIPNNSRNDTAVPSEDDKTITPGTLKKFDNNNDNNNNIPEVYKKNYVIRSVNNSQYEKEKNTFNTQLTNDATDSEIKIQNEYVVVEKKTVEVNELADQLAQLETYNNTSKNNFQINNNNNIQKFISVHPHHKDTSTDPNLIFYERHHTNISSKNYPRSLSPVSGHSNIHQHQPSTPLRKTSCASTNSKGSTSRRGSSVDRHVSVASLNISNALSRALGAATTKLFGTNMKNDATLSRAQNTSIIINTPSIEELIGGILLSIGKDRNMTPNTTNEINNLQYDLEKILAKAFVVYSFAENKINDILSSQSIISHTQSGDWKNRRRSSHSDDAENPFHMENIDEFYTGNVPSPKPRQNSSESTRNLLVSASSSPIPNVEKKISSTNLKQLYPETIFLYMKVLSLLAAGMQLTSHWWYSSKEKNCSTKVNAIVQCIREKFNECLEKADFLRLKWNNLDHSGDSTLLVNQENKSKTNLTNELQKRMEAISVTKLLYERALDLSKNAAKLEIQGIHLSSSELGYCTSIWMLEAILDETSKSNSFSESNFDGNKLDEHDIAIIRKYIQSISVRLKLLRMKMAPAN